MFDFELPSARERDHLKVSRTLSLFSSFFDFGPHRPGNEILQQFLRFYLFPSLIRLGFTLGPYWIPLDPTWVPLGSFLHPPWIHLRLGQPPRGEEGGSVISSGRAPRPPPPLGSPLPRGVGPPPCTRLLALPQGSSLPRGVSMEGARGALRYPQSSWYHPGSTFGTIWVLIVSVLDHPWSPL